MYSQEGVAPDVARQVEQAGEADEGMHKERVDIGESTCAGA